MGFLSDIGGIVGGVLGFSGGQEQNQQSATNAANANLFTEKQLQQRHQWEVADMKKAGLNPIMSAGGTPSIGGSAMAQVPSNPFEEAMSSARQFKQLNAQIDNMVADTELKKAGVDTAKTTQQAQEASAEASRTQAVANKMLAGLYSANAKQSAAGTASIMAELPNKVMKNAISSGALSLNDAVKQWHQNLVKEHAARKGK